MHTRLRAAWWIWRHRPHILAATAVVTAAYGVLWAVTPWGFAHDIGYVYASAMLLIGLAMEVAGLAMRRRR